MPARNTEAWSALHERAHKAGHLAATQHVPTPMHVVERADPFDSNSPVVRTYEPVTDGVCGFAWVNIGPGNASFPMWLKEQGIARRDSYYGGMTIWIGGYEQSMERKLAYATAYTEVIKEALPKLRVEAMSRMD